MGPGVDLADPLAGQVGVDLRCRDTGMTEQLLYDAEVGSPLQEVRRVRVAEGVRRDPLAEAGRGGGALDPEPGVVAAEAPTAIREEDRPSPARRTRSAAASRTAERRQGTAAARRPRCHPPAPRAAGRPCRRRARCRRRGRGRRRRGGAPRSRGGPRRRGARGGRDPASQDAKRQRRSPRSRPRGCDAVSRRLPRGGASDPAPAASSGSAAAVPSGSTAARSRSTSSTVRGSGRIRGSRGRSRCPATSTATRSSASAKR